MSLRHATANENLLPTMTGDREPAVCYLPVFRPRSSVVFTKESSPA